MLIHSRPPFLRDYTSERIFDQEGLCYEPKTRAQAKRAIFDHMTRLKDVEDVCCEEQ